MEKKLPVKLRPRIAIIHPDLGWGGSEACALWAVEALKKDYDVFLITSREVEIDKLNDYYGTNIKLDEISMITVSLPFLFRKINGFSAVRYYRLARFCKRRANEFNVMFSSYNPMDFGKKGIQYILDPTFTDELLRLCSGYPKGVRGWFYKNSLLRIFYLKLARMLGHSTEDGMKMNLTLVDSEWTARLTKEFYKINSSTVYPPVPSHFLDRSWADKEDGFVCIGRINFEKRIDRIIEILDKVRGRGIKIHLHIIGKIGEKKYAQNLFKIVGRNQNWIILEGSVSLQRKMELVAEHKFGIHGRANEPFGIAAAEMVKAGCIVWVASGGGQVEVVNHPGLIYKDIEDAVNKIEQVLKNQTMQVSLRKHLSGQAKKFSEERYQQEIRNVVSQFLKEQRFYESQA